MFGERARLAAVGRHQHELAVAREEQRPAVGRPADDRLIAAFGERELLRRAAADRLPPQMDDEAIGFPVGDRREVGDGFAVGRELRPEEP